MSFLSLITLQFTYAYGFTLSVSPRLHTARHARCGGSTPYAEPDPEAARPAHKTPFGLPMTSRIISPIGSTFDPKSCCGGPVRLRHHPSANSMACPSAHPIPWQWMERCTRCAHVTWRMRTSFARGGLSSSAPSLTHSPSPPRSVAVSCRSPGVPYARSSKICWSVCHCLCPCSVALTWLEL